MRNFSRLVPAVSSVLLLALTAACAPMNTPGGESSYPYPSQSQQYPAQTYPSQQYPAATYPNAQGNYAEYGRVSNVEVLRSQQPAQGTGVGAVIGGVAGAAIGSQIGGGNGRNVATVAGAIGGALAGNAIEKSRNTTVQESFRVSIRMDNGSMRSYDVPAMGELRIGDRVRVENGQLYRVM